MEIDLNNADLDLSDSALAADRTAIRDAIASVERMVGDSSPTIILFVFQILIFRR